MPIVDPNVAQQALTDFLAADKAQTETGAQIAVIQAQHTQNVQDREAAKARLIATLG
jgi:hypothetical protein